MRWLAAKQLGRLRLKNTHDTLMSIAKWKKTIVACGIMSQLAAGASLRATTYSAVNDFSPNSNPGGAWSYGSLSAYTGGTFTRFTTNASNGNFVGQQTWSNGLSYPNEGAVSRDATSGNQTNGGTVFYYPNLLELDGESLISDVRWTAPVTGVYNVSGLFQRTDNSGNAAVSVRVVQNGTTALFSADNFAAFGSQKVFDFFNLSLQAGATIDFVQGSGQASYDSTGLAVTITTDKHPTFLTGEAALGNGVYYLSFSNGNYFGYYSYLADSRYIYHFDLGYEYLFDAADGQGGMYLYDFASNGFFYSSQAFPFPYLYDFNLNSVVYYYPSPTNPGHYNTDGVRYFYVFNTGQIISK